MPRRWTPHPPHDLGVDSDGRLTERRETGVDVHYDDLPDLDVTTVRGIACTTPLRTEIDIVPDLDLAELDHVLRDCLGRGSFTLDHAMEPLAQPDMRSRRGAELLRALLEN